MSGYVLMAVLGIRHGYFVVKDDHGTELAIYNEVPLIRSVSAFQTLLETMYLLI